MKWRRESSQRILWSGLLNSRESREIVRIVYKYRIESRSLRLSVASSLGRFVTRSLRLSVETGQSNQQSSFFLCESVSTQPCRLLLLLLAVPTPRQLWSLVRETAVDDVVAAAAAAAPAAAAAGLSSRHSGTVSRPVGSGFAFKPDRLPDDLSIPSTFWKHSDYVCR